jgi:hypothetical protein
MRNRQRVTVDYNGSLLVLDGVYYAASMATMEDPGEPEEFEIEEVEHCGIYITDIVLDVLYEEFERLALEKLNGLHPIEP